jgi:hypothetical protein
VTYACNLSYLGGRDQPRKITHKNLSQKSPTQKRAGQVTQVVECLPSKHQTSVPPKKKKKYPPVIPAAQDMEIEGLQLKTSLGKISEALSQIQVVHGGA